MINKGKLNVCFQVADILKFTDKIEADGCERWGSAKSWSPLSHASQPEENGDVNM